MATEPCFIPLGEPLSGQDVNGNDIPFPQLTVKQHYNIHWDTKADGTGETILPLTLVTSNPSGTQEYINSEITYYYGMYQTIQYLINKHKMFVKDDMSDVSDTVRDFKTSSDPTEYNVETDRSGFTLSNLLNNDRGFNFLGWFDESGNKIGTLALPAPSDSRNITFTAKYARNSARMIFHDNIN